MVETNLIAAKEIMKQLRLRNIAGMIVIDFITMQSNEDKEQIIKAMREEVRKDSSTMVLHGFTKMGLFEMTRKRTSITSRNASGKAKPYDGWVYTSFRNTVFQNGAVG